MTSGEREGSSPGPRLSEDARAPRTAGRCSGWLRALGRRGSPFQTPRAGRPSAGSVCQGRRGQPVSLRSACGLLLPLGTLWNLLFAHSPLSHRGMTRSVSFCESSRSRGNLCLQLWGLPWKLFVSFLLGTDLSMKWSSAPQPACPPDGSVVSVWVSVPLPGPADPWLSARDSGGAQSRVGDLRMRGPVAPETRRGPGSRWLGQHCRPRADAGEAPGRREGRGPASWGQSRVSAVSSG